ncbi:MAG: hypothetical protein DRJ33_00945 [Candidatus Methanomethylicota archaeon]|uniref:DUF523 domain-containing protein n=1 Tax=Thermoproteota archaeon TaxID=2056631 RepID=A0A497F3J2_9CREN|nr:MAG: hypothetical protein DRJ33_00945 [Candidatus Verstraetearchaeota archaeon]
MSESDVRSMRLVLVAHCILNQNARASGIAKRVCALEEVIHFLLSQGYGLIQLPCPELLYKGVDRPPASKPEYDTPEFRSFCSKLAKLVIEQILIFANRGYKVVGIIGVEHSPTCATSLIPIDRNDLSLYNCGRGIFMEELEKTLASKGMKIPMIGVFASKDRAVENLQILKRSLA